jgi:hypothetical protein
VLGVALALLIVGVVLGFFFPVMFVAALAGLVLLVVFLVGAGKRATAGGDAGHTAGLDRAE